MKLFQCKRTRRLSCDGRLFDQRTVTILMQQKHKKIDSCHFDISATNAGKGKRMSGALVALNCACYMIACLFPVASPRLRLRERRGRC